MSSKKTQAKAGIPEQRRGQQMGDARSKSGSKSVESKKNTPAARGRRKGASKFYADDSTMQVGSDGEAPRDNTPSTPAAIPTGTRLGESGGERAFKRSQAKKKSRV
ncbi:MAG TPA: hypothetical protein VFX96_16450 [Pyrinomonadaceae bacterium]|nr:hypothetical protein [Pyrinomonadaceae bacterium]